MCTLDSIALRYDGQRLTVLDQRLLPDEEVWLDGDDPARMAEHIRNLSVRGAPLIGIAAGLSLGCFARSGVSNAVFEGAAARLRTARPTAVNLMYVVDRVVAGWRAEGPEGAWCEALACFREDVALCDAMGRHGAALVRDGDGLLTHCNAGALATVGTGSALAVVTRAWAEGKRIHVFVDETRPLLQGARLTAWELRRAGVPYTVITDAMAAVVMRLGRVQRVFVGADRVAANGDFANKIGTYGVAVLAAHHGIPFHPVAPATTVDLRAPDGSAIPIEERDPMEVRGAAGAFGRVRWSPVDAPVFNPAFDVTPVSLITSLVTDRGVLSRDDLLAGALPRLLEATR
jgi:methylthioribose-1-phosphate isomerase